MDHGTRKVLSGLLNSRNKLTLKTSSMTEVSTPLSRTGDKSTINSTSQSLNRLIGKRTFWLGIKTNSKVMVGSMKTSGFTMM